MAQLQAQDQKPGLGFPESTPDFTDRDGELCQKVEKLEIGDSGTGEEVRSLVSAPAKDEKSQSEEKVDEEEEELERKKGVIGGEIDEKSDEVGDRAVKVFGNGSIGAIEDVKCSVDEEEEIDVKKEGEESEHEEYGADLEDEEGNDDSEGKDWVEDEEEAMDDYESNWGIPEDGDDDFARFEAIQGPQTFEYFEDGRIRKEQFFDEVNWYENAEVNSVGLNDGKYGSFQYPLRPEAEDCTYYMRTGNCKYGLICKFNHPVTRKKQANEPFKQKEEYSDRPGQTECKYYSTAGGCKYGNSCRFNHGGGKAAVAPNLEFNFIGLPIRVGEQECPYYMRNGSCKFGSSCRFNHPDPTVVGGGDSALQSGLKDNKGLSSARTLTKTAPFVPVMYPPTPTAPPHTEWNGYKAPVYPKSERNLPTPAFSMNIPASNTNIYGQSLQQPIVEDFPARPGQPECSFYLRTGDCKYRSSCKFDHPKSRSPRTPPLALSEHGLPLRPDQSICAHYSRYGICKYGPSCRFNHPPTNGNSASSDVSYHDEPHQYGNLRNVDGNWRRDPVTQQSV